MMILSRPLFISVGLLSLGAIAGAIQSWDRVTLQSDGGRKTRTFDQRIRDVRMVKQLSDRPCRENRNWGHSERTLWVDDGCRAQFEVSLFNGQGNGYGW